MLVVDRVVLHPLHETEQMRELEGGGPAGARRIATPATKSFRSGTCARTLFPAIRSAWPRSRASSRASSVPKNSASVGTPSSSRDDGDVLRRLDAEDRDAAAEEMLEQVAVVRRELDDEARPRRDRAARSSPPRSAARARPSSSSTTRSTRTRGRSRRERRTPRAGRACSRRRRGRGAGKNGSISFVCARRARSSRRAATCRGRRTWSSDSGRRNGIRAQPRPGRGEPTAPSARSKHTVRSIGLLPDRWAFKGSATPADTPGHEPPPDHFHRVRHRPDRGRCCRSDPQPAPYEATGRTQPSGRDPDAAALAHEPRQPPKRPSGPEHEGEMCRGWATPTSSATRSSPARSSTERSPSGSSTSRSATAASRPGA